MSYSIRYGQDTRQEARLKQTTSRKWLGVICIATVIAAGLIWPQVREAVRLLLFPWLDEALAASFGEMLQQISDGTAVPAALMDFCREVIGNGLSPV